MVCFFIFAGLAARSQAAKEGVGDVSRLNEIGT